MNPKCPFHSLRRTEISKRSIKKNNNHNLKSAFRVRYVRYPTLRHKEEMVAVLSFCS